MDTQRQTDTVHSLEVERPVTVGDIARVLGSKVTTVQPVLDALVASGMLCTSMLRCRPHNGADFSTRVVWYHTPESEVTARFGAIFDPLGSLMPPPPQAASLTSLAS